jgi:hypothetical protein
VLPHVVLERGGVRYGVIGVTGMPPDRVKEERLEAALREYRVRDEVESVRASVASLRGGADRIVVLGAISPLHVRKLAAEMPEVDLIVSSDSVLVAPPRAGAAAAYARDPGGLHGKTLVLYTPPTGTPLEVADVEWRKDAPPLFKVRRRELSASDPEDPAVRAIVDDFLGRSRPGRVGPPTGDAYAGSAACAECHAEEAAQWRRTRHAAALETLRVQERHYFPRCVACHSTGPAAKGPEGVGCEACHGPGAGHGEAERRGGKGAIRRDPSEALCRACHDAANDPGFERDSVERRRLVRHGKGR